MMSSANEENKNEEPAGSNTTFDGEDIDNQTVTKLRGDAIGGTVYSERFVLKTLLNLSELQWSDEVEEDLCFLWDMTAERDVCEYLFKLSYPKLACGAILEYSENNRFVEIIVGILANLMCSNCEKQMSDDEISMVLNVLSSDDPLILIQVMRFLHALLYADNKRDFIKPQIVDSIKYILSNCTNKDLILQILKVVVLLTDDLKEPFLEEDFYNSVQTGYEVFLDNRLSDNNVEFDNQTIQHATVELLKIITNFTANVENPKVLEVLKKHYDFILNLITKLFMYYSLQENLLPITDNFTYYCEACVFICKQLEVEYQPELFLTLFKILTILQSEQIHEELKICTKLFCYLITKMKRPDIQNCIHNAGNLKNMLQSLSQIDIGLDQEDLDVLKEFLHELK